MAKVTHRLSSVRERVEHLLGELLPDTTWDRAEGIGLVGDVESGAIDEAELAARLRDLRARPQPAEVTPGRVGDADGRIPGAEALRARAEAVSAWVAAIATRTIDVESFRHRHLRDRLLCDDEVGEWIRRRYERALTPAWRTVGVPEPGWGHAMAQHRVNESGLRHVVLEWAERGDDGWRSGRWPVPPRGPLGDLARLAEKLERRWGWSRPEAALFVLTGFRPYLSPISARTDYKRGWHENCGPYDAPSRVSVRIDPTVTPEQLAAWWRSVRPRLFHARHRSLSVKHLRLAAFHADADDAASWERLRVTWNAEVRDDHPSWQYDDRRTFRRDSVNAVQRVLFRDLRLPS